MRQTEWILKQTNNYDTYWVNIETNKLLIWDILYWDIESMIYVWSVGGFSFFFSNSAYHPEIQIKMYSLKKNPIQRIKVYDDMISWP